MEVFADRYVLTEEKPKAGGMAKVLKAIDTKDSAKLVAIKIFQSTGVENKFIQESFFRETEALRNLRHPNIVPLLDSDFEPSTRELYIVLPWCERTLRDIHGKDKAQDAVQFITEVAQPLLDALSLAHARGVLHRDVKPSNVLIDESGVPKLADFGIAKLTDSLRAGVTMSSFASRPFSPPEQLAGESSAQSDVYALGVTFLDCFTDVPESAAPSDVHQIISNLTLQQPLKILLRRMTAHLPSDRPYNAMIAAEQLKDVLGDLRSSSLPRLDLHLKLSRRALGEARTLFDASGGDTMQSICNDLNSEDVAARLDENSTSDSEHVVLLGREFFYRVVQDNIDRDQLLITTMYAPMSSKLEKIRQSCFPIRANFSERRAISSSQAAQSIERLYEILAESQAHRLLENQGSEEEQVLDKWQKILSLKQALEHVREMPVPYSGFSQVGNGTIRFHLDADYGQSELASLVGQTRRVRTRDQKHLVGEVDDIVDNQLDLYVLRGDVSKLPNKGRLLLDASASHTAIARQRRALLEVLTRTSRRSDLRDLLVRPQDSRLPIVESANSSIDFLQELDPGKQQALRSALASPDLTTIVGPPGTGKTTWIAEFVAQIVRRSPDAKILLTGQTHIAVDNAVDKIRKLADADSAGNELRIVRLGAVDRISSANTPIGLQQGLTNWLSQVRNKSSEWLEQWAISNHLNRRDKSASILLASLESQVQLRKELKTKLDSLQIQREKQLEINERLQLLEDDLMQRAAVLESLTSSTSLTENSSELLKRLTEISIAHTNSTLHLIDVFGDVKGQCREDVAKLDLDISGLATSLQTTDERSASIRQELANALGSNAIHDVDLDALGKLVEEHEGVKSPEFLRYQHLQLLQSSWHQRLGSDRSFETLFVAEADIVAGTCIGVAQRLMEGASFDVVIIDEASKASPTEAIAAMTMGKSWVLVGDDKQLPPFVDEALLEDDLMSRFDLTREDLATTLFDRMLVGLPQECKSELNVQHRMVKGIGDLISKCFYSGRLTTGRSDEGNEYLRNLMPTPVTWLSTSKLPNRHERRSGESSYLNSCEADHVCKLLERAESLLPPDRTFKVGVITGYGAQREMLHNMIKPSSEQWTRLQIEVNSVDAFQGREVDLLLYSVTRSNDAGRLGFLRLHERLNVALSRGRDSLIIIGDAEFCRSSTDSENPFLPVLSYFSASPTTCRLIPLTK